MINSQLSTLVLIAYNLDIGNTTPESLKLIHKDQLPKILDFMINEEAKQKLEDYILIRKLTN